MKNFKLELINHILLVLILVFSAFSGLYALQVKPQTTPHKTSVNAQTKTQPKQALIQPSPLPPVSPTPAQPNPIPVGNPSQISIPSIDLTAQISPVGITTDNYMDIPKQAQVVGWYDRGAKPGQIGGAILNGHFDTPTGKPAVFYHLNQLQPNQQIFITTEDGQQITYLVDSITAHPLQGFPTELVYGEYNSQKLIIITCNGVWDPIQNTYANRLVVTADIWKTT